MMNRMKAWGAAMTAAAVLLTAGCGTAATSTREMSRGSAQQTVFPHFVAKDLAGNTVTEELFAKNKVTVINIWGTFCPPCIGEMPELAAWSKSMPEGVQLVGIVCDVEGEGDAETIAAAREIMEKAGGDFVNLLPDEAILKYLENVEAVPTTIFVDNAGNILGKPVIGADVDQYKQRVKEYLK